MTMMIKCLDLEKKKEKNKKLKAKVKFDRSLLVCTQDTIVGVSDLGLIVVLLRGVKLVSKYGCQSATRCSNSMHMHLGSSGMLTPLKIFVKIC
jgi:hypothetical protein